MVIRPHIGRSVGANPQRTFAVTGGRIDDRDDGSRARCRLTRCVSLSDQNKTVLARVRKKRSDGPTVMMWSFLAVVRRKQLFPRRREEFCCIHNQVVFP